jgi:hypothetical protein
MNRRWSCGQCIRQRAPSINDAFTNLKAAMEAGDTPITEPTLDALAAITQKRYAQQPQLYALTVDLVLYNLMYVVPGFLGFFFGWRRRRRVRVDIGRHLGRLAHDPSFSVVSGCHVALRRTAFSNAAYWFGVTAHYVATSSPFRRLFPTKRQEAMRLDATPTHSDTPAVGVYEHLEDRMMKRV